MAVPLAPFDEPHRLTRPALRAQHPSTEERVQVRPLGLRRSTTPR
jgi:hypothetical protein